MAATGFERRSVFSPLAARAAAEIAEEHGPALKRELPDGSIEVATLRKRRLYRHLVDPAGGSMLLDVAPRSPRQRRLRALNRRRLRRRRHRRRRRRLRHRGR